MFGFTMAYPYSRLSAEVALYVMGWEVIARPQTKSGGSLPIWVDDHGGFHEGPEGYAMNVQSGMKVLEKLQEEGWQYKISDNGISEETKNEPVWLQNHDHVCYLEKDEKDSIEGHGISIERAICDASLKTRKDIDLTREPWNEVDRD